MASNTWSFDGKEVIGTHGSVLKWDDHQFFTLTYKGQKFFGELLEDNSEDNSLKIKINQRVFEVKKKGELDDLISEIETIVLSGTKINISYYIDSMMDADKQEEIIDYFKESESDSLEDAIDELGEEDFTQEEIRLVRIKFLSEFGN